MPTPDRRLTRGQLAARAGVNPETVRYYEQRGLLPAPPRSPGGYRLYTGETVRRLRFIKRAQELGFTLAEIHDLLSLRAGPSPTRADVRRRAQEKIEEIEAKLHDLTSMKQTLESLVRACHGDGPAEDCPIVQALDGTAPSPTPSTRLP